MEVRVSRKAVAERANGKTIEGHVLKWQKEVEEIQESAKVFSEKYKNRSSWRCIKWLPIPKPVSRFQLGRESVQKAKRVTELFNSGTDLLAHEIVYLPPVENLPATDNTFQNFESRKDAYGKLWEALVTEGSPLILGIYGMPGVGKTRMVEQLWEAATEKKIFDKVARADVGSDNLDVIKVQNQIAYHLDCHFDSQDDMKHRANQLKNSLMNGGKILIILDDVWREIPLDIIGISLDNGSSSKFIKILLTSRKKDVCLRNNCKLPINITTLSVDEAWALFRNSFGTSQIDFQDESLAQKVCLKCAGLPLLIRAVGKALQFTSQNSWNDALDQLQKGKFENIAGIDPQVYACVKLSIDRLPEDAKSCLLLFSLFPEDADIDIRKLIQLATSTQLITDGEYRICAMVDILRTSSLVLDCELDHKIKLHDLVRDVARSIAVKDPTYAFLLVRCGSRLLDNADYSTRKLLHLHLQQNDFRFPDGLLCPDLHNLWLQCNDHIQQFSGGFFSMFVNLRFLFIEGMSSTSELHFSLQPLNQLKTLILGSCGLKNIDQTNVSLFPENLKTLCVWNSSLPKPLNLPNLKYLRKLEIKGGSLQMMPNTISSLPSLEKLHIPNGFYLADDHCSRPILVEISGLTHLKSLNVPLTEYEPFEDINIFSNLLEFNICVGEPGADFCYLPNSNVFIKRSIQLHGIQCKVLEILVERAEQVILNYSDMNVGSIYNSNREAFTDLSELFIDECKSMEYIARISQDEI